MIYLCEKYFDNRLVCIEFSFSSLFYCHCPYGAARVCMCLFTMKIWSKSDSSLLTLRKIYWIEKYRRIKFEQRYICHTPFFLCSFSEAVKTPEVRCYIKLFGRFLCIHYVWSKVLENMCIKIANGPTIKFTNSNGKLFDRLSSANRTTEQMANDRSADRANERQRRQNEVRREV